MVNEELLRKVDEGSTGRESERKERELHNRMSSDERREFHRRKDREFEVTEKIGAKYLQSDIRKMIEKESVTGIPVEEQVARREESERESGRH